LGECFHQVLILCPGQAADNRQKAGVSNGILLDPAGAVQQTWQELENQRQRQPGSMAYSDVFWLCAILGVTLVVLVLLMKRSVAETGEHIGAE
jgi:hypothetical protein